VDVVEGISAAEPYARTGVYLTIGNFDGVHLGHQALLERTRELAHAQELKAAVLTFWPHPQTVLTDTPPQLLSTRAQRQQQIAETGIDLLVVQPFNRDFAETLPYEFLELLHKHLHVRGLILGHDFRFGHRGQGTVALAEEYAAEHDIEVEEFPPFQVRGMVVSSSRIRTLLAQGDVARAFTMLSGPWTIQGRPTSGAGRGRTLGFPTVNLDTDNDLVVADGVYGGRIRVGTGPWYIAAISVGTNPTFGAEPRHVEAFILDYPDAAIEGLVTLEFWHYVRAQVAYTGAEKLIQQMEADVALIRDIAAQQAWLTR